MLDLPKQRLSFKKKAENEFEWAKKTMDALLVNTYYSYDSTGRADDDYDRMLSNYRLYNNIIDQKDFERDCNPLGINVGQVRDIIRPYNKTYNKIQVLLGDEQLRPFNYKVVLTNSDGINSKLAHRDSLLRSYVYSQIQETITNISPMFKPELLEEDTKHIMKPEEIDSYMSTRYMEAREITANKILTYLGHKLSIKELKNDAFKHALISAVEAVYLTIENDEPKCKVVNPLNFFYHKSPDLKYVQDSAYAGTKNYLTTGEVLDHYGAWLTKKQIDDIEESKSIGSNLRSYEPSKAYQHEGANFTNTWGSTSSPYHIVEHVEWKSQKKVGFLTYTTEDGEEQTMVSEDFVVPSYAKSHTEVKEYGKKCKYYEWEDLTTAYKLEWTWIPEVWQGVRINQNIYCQIGPVPHQFRSLDNPYDIKLSYHGTVYNATNAAPTGPMDRMKPFQYLYLIVMHKLKELISQDIGKVYNFDLSMLDPELGLEKTMYYLKDMKINFFNSMQGGDMPGASQRSSVQSATDMSNTQHILNYVNLLNSLDQQISDVAGVSRQREGQITQNEAVGNAQANIQNSAVITEIYYYQHNQLWKEILSSLLNITQAAWKEKSITKQYVLDDLSLATLQLSPSDLDNAQFAVFVTDSPKEQKLFDSLQMLSDRLLQANKAKFSDLVDLYSAVSTSQLKSTIVQSEERTMKEAQQQQQQQMEGQQKLQQEAQAYEAEEKQKDRDHEIRIAEIEALKFLKENDYNHNQIPDALEVEKFKHDVEMDHADVQLRNKELDIKNKVAEKRATPQK